MQCVDIVAYSEQSAGHACCYAFPTIFSTIVNPVSCMMPLPTPPRPCSVMMPN